MLLQYHFIVGNWKIIISQSDMEYLKKYYMLWEQERVNNVTHRKLCQERDTGGGGGLSLEPCKFQKHDFEIKVDPGFPDNNWLKVMSANPH